MAGPVNANTTPPSPSPTRPAPAASRGAVAATDPRTVAAFRERLNQAAERHDPARSDRTERDGDEREAGGARPRDAVDPRNARGQSDGEGDGDGRNDTGAGAGLSQTAATLAGNAANAIDAARGTSAVPLDTLARMAAAIAEGAPGAGGVPVTLAFPAQWGLGSGAVLAADTAGRVNLTLVGLPAGMTTGAGWTGVAGTLRLALRARDVRVGTIRHAREDDPPSPLSQEPGAGTVPPNPMTE